MFENFFEFVGIENSEELSDMEVYWGIMGQMIPK